MNNPAGIASGIVDGRTVELAVLEADCGDPGREGTPELTELGHHGVTEFHDIAVEQGSDAAESSLVQELTQRYESIEESVNRRDGFGQLRPEVTGDDVQGDANDETTQAATAQGIGQLIDPVQDSGGGILNEVAVSNIGEGHLSLATEGMETAGLLGCGLGIIHGVILLVVVVDGILGDCFCVLDVLILIHIVTPSF